DKKTYHEVIAEIYEHEPFLKGTHASTAFCLLYKLWTLKLTIKQIEGLIDNPDSPHIRAIGFLYLRYVCDPADLWSWFGDYLEDDEEVRVEGGVRPRVMTIGKVCKDLLLEQKWLGTMLPRIPVLIARDLEAKVKEVLAATAKNGPAGPAGAGGGGAGGVGRGRGGGRSPPPRIDRRRSDDADLDYGDDSRGGRGNGSGGKRMSRSRSRSPAGRYRDDSYGRGGARRDDYGRGRGDEFYGRGGSRDDHGRGRGDDAYGRGGPRDDFGKGREHGRGGRDARSRSPSYRRRSVSPPPRKYDDRRDDRRDYRR
ncbi:PRP38 family-domain-containing protein, partial [Chytriomyces sp. MP71]